MPESPLQRLQCRRQRRSKSMRSSTGRPSRWRRRQSSPISTAPARTQSRPPIRRAWREHRAARRRRCRCRSCRRSRAGRRPRRARSAGPAHGWRRCPCELAARPIGRLGRHAVDAELARIARHDALAEHALGAGQRRHARREMAAAEHLRRRQRMAALEQVASITPSSVWSSSAMMKLPSRLRTSASTGASRATRSASSSPRTASLVSSCG